MKLAKLFFGLLLILQFQGCAFFKPAARTVNDAAKIACETMLSRDAELQGISVEELCAAREVLDPFVRQLLAAQAGARAGMKPPEAHEAPSAP